MGRRSDHTPAELHRNALDAAREIVHEGGLAALSTRAIARKIGYTAGTLYQIFRNIDDLIEQMNAETIDELRGRCEQIDFADDPGENLLQLAECYAAYTAENAAIWSAIFEHRLPKGYQRFEGYEQSVGKLLSVIERAVAPFYRPGEEAERAHDIRVLWTWLYGISGLTQVGRVSKGESFERMIETVIEMYVGSRKPK